MHGSDLWPVWLCSYCSDKLLLPVEKTPLSFSNKVQHRCTKTAKRKKKTEQKFPRNNPSALYTRECVFWFVVGNRAKDKMSVTLTSFCSAVPAESQEMFQFGDPSLNLKSSVFHTGTAPAPKTKIDLICWIWAHRSTTKQLIISKPKLMWENKKEQDLMWNSVFFITSIVWVEHCSLRLRAHSNFHID